MTAPTSERARIAIVGAGVAGLTAARALRRNFDVSVFEANDYAGGHSNTVEVEVENQSYAVDTGFIVCNDRNYPSFMEMLRELRVDLTPTQMSFSVSNPALDLEYNGHNLNTLFARRDHLWRGSFLRMLLDILRFNRAARRYQGAGTVEEFVGQRRFGRLFADNYLLPMVAAIWSCEPRQAEVFPMTMLTRFFNNHGLLDLFNRPRWFSIAGGSKSYVGALIADFADRIRLSTSVRGVSREPGGVRLRFDGGSELFDKVVLACHSDQALALLESPGRAESEILGAIRYRPNSVLLHHDDSLMPRNRRAWASWNFRTGNAANGRPPVITYCMNILQQLPAPKPLLVSLNAEHLVDQGKVLGEFSYSHPQYCEQSLRAQARLGEIDGVDRIHYCGAWCHDGFHEDAVRSALATCRRLERAA